MYEDASLAIRVGTQEDPTTREFFHHSSAQRTFTQAVIVESLAKQYPGLPITSISAFNCSLLEYAALGFAQAGPINESQISPLRQTSYTPAFRRQDAGRGSITEELIYAKYWYCYKGDDYILYVISGRDGTATPYQGLGRVDMQYLIGAQKHVADEIIKLATEYKLALHDEIYVFDQGYWQKSAELYQSIMKASWDDVILDADMKKAIRTDVLRFFASSDRYAKLKVAWKRGIIYYGSPGNGKTISIKAMMHTLYDLPDPIPTLYVRSLSSFGGPEQSVKQIFSMARRQSPCMLVFEDLDTLVTDAVRTYFLNEVDGLQTNEGVLMIGSTNHLEKLDPGISKRPSRFDRKFEFAKPNLAERISYCEFWQGKLSDNKDIEFPNVLCTAIAEETRGFSFAYMQEAFVATLLTIAAEEDDKTLENVSLTRDDKDSGGDDRKLMKYILWRVIKRQIRILREEM